MQRTYADYVAEDVLEKNDHQLHSVIKARKKPLPHSKQDPSLAKFGFFHYLKFEDDAALEVRAQEFFRLMYPAQPKTRLILRGKNKVVASKEVPILSSLPEWGWAKLHADIKSGAVTGFGKILLLSLLTQEVDFKESNIVINNKKQMIKLDGGCCFWNLQRTRSRMLRYFTSKDYAALPFIEDFEVCNWLGLYEYDTEQKKVYKSKREWLTPEMKQWQTIRDEIHEMTLAFLMMPDEFIKAFDKAYPNRKNYLVANRLIDARKTLKGAAMDDPRFLKYLLSPKADQDVEKYIAQFAAFHPKGKRTLNAERHKGSMRAAANTLKEQAKLKPETRRYQLLQKIHAISGPDAVLLKPKI